MVLRQPRRISLSSKEIQALQELEIQEDSPGAVLKGRLEYMYRVGSILTFGGGTNEVQRDIISAAGLGMPRSR